MCRYRLATLAIFWVATAHADSTTLTLTSSSFNIVAGSPITQTVTNVPTVTNLLGIGLSGNWTAVSGNPWSNELLVGVTAPGSTTVAPVFYGGMTNSNPFSFPGPSFNSNGFALSAAPVNVPAGNYTFTFDQDFPGTVANLQNATMTLYHNPTSVTGTTVGGPTAARPVASGNATSSSGSAVPYQAFTLTTTVGGRHLLVLSGGGQDTFLTVYGPGGYNPATPLENLIAANDDDPNLNSVASSIIVDLPSVGSSYTVVVTGYENTDAGSFTLYAAGSGLVTLTPVPESSFILLSAAVFFGTGAALRIRVR